MGQLSGNFTSATIPSLPHSRCLPGFITSHSLQTFLSLFIMGHVLFAFLQSPTFGKFFVFSVLSDDICFGVLQGREFGQSLFLCVEFPFSYCHGISPFLCIFYFKKEGKRPSLRLDLLRFFSFFFWVFFLEKLAYAGHYRIKLLLDVVCGAVDDHRR